MQILLRHLATIRYLILKRYRITEKSLTNLPLKERRKELLAIRARLTKAQHKGNNVARLGNKLLPVVQELSGSTGQRFPNLILGGFGKCGTSTLHQWLAGAPEVASGVIKEVRYLKNFSNADIELYRAFFPDSEAKYMFDGTPGYSLMTERQMKNAAQILGAGVKVIFITRDPVRRSISAYRSPGVVRSLERRSRMPVVRDMAADFQTESDAISPMLRALRKGNATFDEVRAAAPSIFLLSGLQRFLRDRFLSYLLEPDVLNLTLERDLSAKNRGKTIKKLESFLGVSVPPPRNKHTNQSQKEPIPEQAIKIATTFFEEFRDLTYI